ncbi:MAG: 3-keto-5-aminohexanoate cleavage protein [Candidatus Caldarchaeum sp.]
MENIHEKLIITVAPTGSGPQWKKTPYIPIAPEEIAKDAVKAYREGASVVHIHARDPLTKSPSPEVSLYRQIVEMIREECDMVIQLTTSGGAPYGISLEQRINLLLEIKPEFASLNVATMSFGDGVFINPPDFVRKLAMLMIEHKIKPEVECYDIGHIDLMNNLIREGLITNPVRASLVLGVKGGIQPSVENLLHMVRQLPPGARWNTIVVGRHQFPLLTVGMVMGGDVRVGMEDNIYLGRGILAKSNAELVGKVVRIAKELGREIANPSEAREMLGIEMTS